DLFGISRVATPSRYRGGLPVRGSTILEILLQEQEWMLAELRHAQRGGVLTLHVLLLCAAGRTPTEIAAFLFYSRTSVYRMVSAYHARLRDARCNQPLSR